MGPAERIPVINRIADRLAAEEDWSEIDFVLDQFGFETFDHWSGSYRDYVRRVLRNAPSEMLSSLDNYLSGQVPPGEAPWAEGRFRLFISHIAKQKLSAHELKSAMAFYGVDAFVAHQDIKSGKEWQQVIEAALHSCHALVALLHEGFKESNWCEQEVGFALGRGVPVVPMKIELDPYGFLGSVQAVIPGKRELKDVARELLDIFLGDKRTSEAIVEAIVRRLVESESFEQSNGLAKLLADEPGRVSADQLKRLRQAQKENFQVLSAWDVDGWLGKIEAALAATTTATAAPPSGSGRAWDPDGIEMF
jgi:hypothetical protein